MERKFNVGDKVRLISKTKNNIEMVVRGYAYDIANANPTSAPFIGDFKKQLKDMVTCDWNDKNGCPKSKSYNENELEKCE